jgi:hypothetical protein
MDHLLQVILLTAALGRVGLPPGVGALRETQINLYDDWQAGKRKD